MPPVGTHSLVMRDLPSTCRDLIKLRDVPGDRIVERGCMRRAVKHLIFDDILSDCTLTAERLRGSRYRQGQIAQDQWAI